MQRKGSGRSGGGPSNFSRGRSDNGEPDVERTSPQQQENPEMPESGAGNSNARAPEEDYDHGQGVLAAEEDRSQRGDDRSPRENGHAEEHKSPRYSASDRGGPDYGSPVRRGSNDYPEDDEEKRHRRRDSRSGSRGRRSNSRSPRGGAGPRQRRDGSREPERDSGPFTQVYVTGFSRSSRR